MARWFWSLQILNSEVSARHLHKLRLLGLHDNKPVEGKLYILPSINKIMYLIFVAISFAKRVYSSSAHCYTNNYSLNSFFLRPSVYSWTSQMAYPSSLKSLSIPESWPIIWKRTQCIWTLINLPRHILRLKGHQSELGERVLGTSQFL